LTTLTEQPGVAAKSKPWLRHGTAISLSIATALFLAVTAFLYWRPFTSSFGSIQWDALEVHFYNLSYAGRLLHEGLFPGWTPYIFGGFPQVADPQVSMWYPVNPIVAWIGSSDAILWELALHQVLAGVGAFLLFRQISRNLFLSLGLASVYAFGGFMVGHGTHLGMQNTAAWSPLLLWAAWRAIDSRSPLLALVTGSGLALAILAGHFQSALYLSTFLGAFSLFRVWLNRSDGDRRQVWRNLGLIPLIYVVALGLAAVQLLPTFELAQLSQRSDISLDIAQVPALDWSSLRGLVDANYRGVLLGPYTGPQDWTQNYLFLGPVTLVLGLVGLFAGLTSKQERPLTLFLLATAAGALLFALGSGSFVHEFAYRLVPLYDKVRGPINVLFIAELAVLMLAAKSAGALQRVHSNLRTPLSAVLGLGLMLPVVVTASQTQLLWARAEAQSERPLLTLERDYAAAAPLDRFRTYQVPGLTQNEPQLGQIESFDGYNPLALQRHADFAASFETSPRLIDVAGIKYLPCSNSAAAGLEPTEQAPGVCTNPGYFKRLTLVDSVRVAEDASEALALTRLLDLRETAVLEKPAEVQGEAAAATQRFVEAVAVDPGHIVARVATPAQSFLLLNEAFYPGWKATVDGAPVEVYRADYLFSGLVLSPGVHTVEFRFESPALRRGEIISAATLLLVLGGASALLFRARQEGAQRIEAAVHD
jgi:hypothetical protein